MVSSEGQLTMKKKNLFTVHAHPAATAPLRQTQGVQGPQQLQPGYGGLFRQDYIKMSVFFGD